MVIKVNFMDSKYKSFFCTINLSKMSHMHFRAIEKLELYR